MVLMEHNNIPIKIAASTASPAGQFRSDKSLAIITPFRDIAYPIDKSIFPDIMIRDTPIAAINRYAFWLTIFKRFRVVRNVSEKNPNTMARQISRNQAIFFCIRFFIFVNIAASLRCKFQYSVLGKLFLLQLSGK